MLTASIRRGLCPWIRSMWQCVAGGDPFCVFLGHALEMRRRPEIQSRIPFRSWMIACVLLPLCWLGSNLRVVYSGDLDLWVPEDSSTVTTRGSFRWRIDPTRGLVFPRFSPRTSPRLKRGPPDFWHDAIGINNSRFSDTSPLGSTVWQTGGCAEEWWEVCRNTC